MVQLPPFMCVTDRVNALPAEMVRGTTAIAPSNYVSCLLSVTAHMVLIYIVMDL